MAVHAILGSILQSVLAPGVQSKFKQFQQEFQRIGQDLQTGNLAQAQTDFAALQRNAPAAVAAPSTGAGLANTIRNPIPQEFSELAKDLATGNLAAARQAYNALVQDFQGFAAQSSGPAGTSPSRLA